MTITTPKPPAFNRNAETHRRQIRDYLLAVGDELENVALTSIFEYILAAVGATPAANECSRDNADPTLVMELQFNEITIGGRDISLQLGLVTQGDRVAIQQQSDPAIIEVYDVSVVPAAPIAGVYTFTVVPTTNAGIVTVGEQVNVATQSTGTADASAMTYNPADDSDWDPSPTLVAPALDQLADTRLIRPAVVSNINSFVGFAEIDADAKQTKMMPPCALPGPIGDFIGTADGQLASRFETERVTVYRQNFPNSLSFKSTLAIPVDASIPLEWRLAVESNSFSFPTITYGAGNLVEVLKGQTAIFVWDPVDARWGLVDLHDVLIEEMGESLYDKGYGLLIDPLFGHLWAERLRIQTLWEAGPNTAEGAWTIARQHPPPPAPSVLDPYQGAAMLAFDGTLSAHASTGPTFTHKSKVTLTPGDVVKIRFVAAKVGTAAAELRCSVNLEGGGLLNDIVTGTGPFPGLVDGTWQVYEQTLVLPAINTGVDTVEVVFTYQGVQIGGTPDFHVFVDQIGLWVESMDAPIPQLVMQTVVVKNADQTVAADETWEKLIDWVAPTNDPFGMWDAANSRFIISPDLAGEVAVRVIAQAAMGTTINSIEAVAIGVGFNGADPDDPGALLVPVGLAMVPESVKSFGFSAANLSTPLLPASAGDNVELFHMHFAGTGGNFTRTLGGAVTWFAIEVWA